MTATPAPTSPVPEAAADLPAALPPSRRLVAPLTPRQRLLALGWRFVRATLFRLSPPFSHGWRAMLLRVFGARIGRCVRIAASARIDCPWNLCIGDRAHIAERVIINCIGPVSIGRNTRVSQYSHLCAATHEYQSRDMPIVGCPIIVGNDVWIAADAFIGPGVTIGDNCIVAARSSLFRDLEPGQVCHGEPARPYRDREHPLTQIRSV